MVYGVHFSSRWLGYQHFPQNTAGATLLRSDRVLQDHSLARSTVKVQVLYSVLHAPRARAVVYILAAHYVNPPSMANQTLQESFQSFPLCLNHHGPELFAPFAHCWRHRVHNWSRWQAPSCCFPSFAVSPSPSRLVAECRSIDSSALLSCTT